jgi:hypothetical protein
MPFLTHIVEALLSEFFEVFLLIVCHAAGKSAPANVQNWAQYFYGVRASASVFVDVMFISVGVSAIEG